MMKTVTIYTDGACSGNPGAGGYGGELETTNNRMKLMGAIAALEALKEPCKVELFSDSSYIVKGMNEWMQGWLANGWKNSNRKAIMNADLWQRLLAAARTHSVTFTWTKGHAGCPMNERANMLARNTAAGTIFAN